MDKLRNSIICGDALSVLSGLPEQCVQMCVTSPPYWSLRDYGVGGQLGLEQMPEEYTAKVVEIFREVRRVLRDDGALWLNLGDSYAGSWGNAGHRPELDGTPSSQREKNTDYFNRGGYDNRRSVPPNQNVPGLKPKDLCGIPWRVAFALQADGWYLRSDIIWSKPNPMPESVRDRPTKAHEYIFLMSKKRKYYYDIDAVREIAQVHRGTVLKSRESGTGLARGMGGQADRQGNFKTSELGRNRRTVWTVTAKPYRGAHFATYPVDLIEPCILAGSRKGDIVLDPFMGAGTTAIAALKHNRNYLGIELKPEYIKLAQSRINTAIRKRHIQRSKGGDNQ